MIVALAIDEGASGAVAREVRTEGAMIADANARGQVWGANMTGRRGMIVTGIGAAMRLAGGAAPAKGIKTIKSTFLRPSIEIE